MTISDRTAERVRLPWTPLMAALIATSALTAVTSVTTAQAAGTLPPHATPVDGTELAAAKDEPRNEQRRDRPWGRARFYPDRAGEQAGDTGDTAQTEQHDRSGTEQALLVICALQLLRAEAKALGPEVASLPRDVI